MMTTTRILVLDRTEDLAADIKAAMAGIRPTVSVDSSTDATGIADAVRDQGPYDVLVVGPTMGNRSMVATLELMHDDVPAMSIVLTFLRRPTATMREIVRTGACDLLQVPVDEKELQESLLRAIELATKLRSTGGTHAAPTYVPTGSPAERQPGRVFTTSSATGGCGKTFLATNLA